MAFAWDDIQGRWLARRFAGRCERFEGKVAVAGGSLEIDALATNPEPDGLFGLLTPLSIFENKAPQEVFNGKEMLLVAARTLLLLRRLGLDPGALRQVSQVVLCSHATATLKRQLKLEERRPGLWEGHFTARLLVLEANGLPVAPETLAFLVHYASGQKLREAVEMVIEREQRDLYWSLGSSGERR